MLVVSYSRHDIAVVKRLSSDLAQFGREVWLDERLEGGVEWWEEILEAIRGCEAFLYVVSASSLASRPCRDELAYALALDRPVVPIALRADLEETLPAELVGLQVVGYADGTKDEVADLLRALSAVHHGRPLPDPLPPAPRLPVSRYAQLRDELMVERLDGDKQVAVLGRLQQWWEEEGDLDRTRNLVEELRNRPDLLASMVPEVDALSRQLASDNGGPDPSRRSRWTWPYLSRNERVELALGGFAVVALVFGQLSGEVYHSCTGCPQGWGGARARLPYVVLAAVLVAGLSTSLTGRARRFGPMAVLAAGIALLGQIWIDVRQMTTGDDEIALFGAGAVWTTLAVLLALAAGAVAVTSRFETQTENAASRRGRDDDSTPSPHPKLRPGRDDL